MRFNVWIGVDQSQSSYMPHKHQIYPIAAISACALLAMELNFIMPVTTIPQNCKIHTVNDEFPGVDPIWQSNIRWERFKQPSGELLPLLYRPDFVEHILQKIDSIFKASTENA
jgi:hypothetical protein